MPDTNPWKHIKKSECPHIKELKEDIKSDADSCEICSHKEDLRICLTCGAVHCCESHNSHNTEHFRKTGHPFISPRDTRSVAMKSQAIIKPYKSDYSWLWCYSCNAFLE